MIRQDDECIDVKWIPLAHAARDLRYWTARRSTAQLMPAPENAEKVQFGSTVTIERDDGRRQTWRIVGEDEADPAQGTLSYVSPVARALNATPSSGLTRPSTTVLARSTTATTSVRESSWSIWCRGEILMTSCVRS